MHRRGGHAPLAPGGIGIVMVRNKLHAQEGWSCAPRPWWNRNSYGKEQVTCTGGVVMRPSPLVE